MRLRRLLVLLWVAGTLALAGHLGSSERTQSLLLPLLLGLGMDVTSAQRTHKVLRKCGHVLAYAGFALLVWWALEGTRARAGVTLLAVLALAVVDESAQAFFTDRGASGWDVLLDLLAGAAAVAWAERRARGRAARSSDQTR